MFISTICLVCMQSTISSHFTKKLTRLRISKLTSKLFLIFLFLLGQCGKDGCDDGGGSRFSRCGDIVKLFKPILALAVIRDADLELQEHH